MSRSGSLAIVVAGVMVLVLRATPAPAGEPETVAIRPVDVPASGTNDPRAQFYIVDHVAPGATLRRQVEVINDTTQPRDIALYVAAADIGGGEFRLGDAGAANELTGWTTVTPTMVRLGPGAKGDASVTITVPSGATSGERYAVAWAAVSASSSPGGGILEVNRVGVRIYLSVGPGEEPPTDFAITSLASGQSSDGRPIVTALVRNTGGRAVDLSGSLWLRRDAAARAVGPFAAELGPTLGIGEAEPVLVPVRPGVSPGPWDASLVLHSGSTERSGTTRLTLPRSRWSASGELHTTPAPTGTRRLASVVGAVVVLALLSAAVVRRRLRHATGPDRAVEL
jgi:hypothetical protein